MITTFFRVFPKVSKPRQNQRNYYHTFVISKKIYKMTNTNNNLQNATITLFQQMEVVLKQCHQESFTQPISILSHASIGQHFRHIIEFYQELFNGIQDGVVNYENRQRQILIESSPNFALSQMEDLVHQVHTLDFTSSLFLHARFTPNENEKPTTMLTSVSRELMYAFDHSIHHLAIIGIGIQSEFSYIEIPKNLGVAPSTIRYREECAH